MGGRQPIHKGATLYKVGGGGGGVGEVLCSPGCLVAVEI